MMNYWDNGREQERASALREKANKKKVKVMERKIVYELMFPVTGKHDLTDLDTCNYTLPTSTK